LLLLSGCNETTVSGEVLAEGTEGAWVCLDTNGDLLCDDTEPGGAVQAGGAFQFPRPTLMAAHAMNLVVQVPDQPTQTLPVAPLPAGAFVMATPARDDGAVVTGLSTLLAMHRSAPGQGEEEDIALVESELKRTLGLPDEVSLLAAPGSDEQRDLKKLDAWVVTALRQGAQAHSQTSAGDAGPTGASTRAAAEVLAPIIGRYTQAETGQLLHTVGARTLVHETKAAFVPHTCVTLPPPLVVIDTAGGAPVVDKESYVQAQLTMGATADFPQGTSRNLSHPEGA
jgi:hypothetical protein